MQLMQCFRSLSTINKRHSNNESYTNRADGRLTMVNVCWIANSIWISNFIFSFLHLNVNIWDGDRSAKKCTVCGWLQSTISKYIGRITHRTHLSFFVFFVVNSFKSIWIQFHSNIRWQLSIQITMSHRFHVFF